jgi:hypothetical protein
VDLSAWFRPSFLGWWISIPASGLFAAYLVWIRGRIGVQSYAPLLFIGLALASALAHYARSDWHRHFGNHALWLSGVGSILVVAPLPLILTLLWDWLIHRAVSNAARRAVLTATLAILVTFLIQQPLAWHAADAVLRLVR